MFKKIKEHVDFIGYSLKRRDINTLRLLHDYGSAPKKLPKPKVITISPFDFCNLRCKMCDAWKQPKKEGYKNNISRLETFLSETKSYFGNDILIVFSGGEIFQDDVIFNLISKAEELGFPVILDSNATLIDDIKIKKLKKTRVERINVSIDGYTRETHDFIRGVKGSYDRTMAAVEKLHSNGFKVYINTVMMKQNSDEILSLIDFATKSENINGINLLMIMPDNSQNPKSSYADLYPEEFKSKANGILDELISIKKNNPKLLNPASHLERYKLYLSNPGKFVKDECDMKLDKLFLNSHMTLHLCPYLPQINLMDRKISDVWNTVEMRYRYSLRKQCSKNCMFIVNYHE